MLPVVGELGATVMARRLATRSSLRSRFGSAIHQFAPPFRKRSVMHEDLEIRPSAERGLSRELGSGRTRVEGLGSCSGRSRRPPILKRFASESAERIAGNEMALDVERVLDCGMNGQEPLC
jgi:hypothetical protein